MSEILRSVGIDNLTQQRLTMLSKFSEIFDLTEEIDRLGRSCHAGSFNDVMLNYQSGRIATQDDDPFETCRARIDRDIWKYLMDESGISTYMDAAARKAFRDDLNEPTSEVPEISKANITATFQELYQKRGDMMERGIINVFKALSWSYKTNSPCKFGKKIIMDGMVSYNSNWGFSNYYSERRDRLSDLDRIFRVMDGKLELDYRDSVGNQFSEKVTGQNQTMETDYFSLKWYKKGSLHLTFKNPEICDKLNDVIVKHYPGALPPKV